MKQKKINCLFAIVIVLLIIIIGLMRINEHKRVAYYVCYENYYTTWGSPSEEDVKRFEEICERQLEERN